MGVYTRVEGIHLSIMVQREMIYEIKIVVAAI